MKYLLLDSNIYINLVVNRNKTITNKVISNFKTLLEKSDIKIILPEIVEYEVYKNLDSEINRVGLNVRNQQKNLDNMWWFSGIIEEEDDNFEINRKKAKKALDEISKSYTDKSNLYTQTIKENIDNIFENEKTIKVKGDADLYKKVLERKIFKRAPMHKENKDSLADALIIEILLGLERNSDIDLEIEDTIYFVTENIEDFSNGREEREKIHSDIKEDLEKESLIDKVKYCINFSKLIAVDLKKEYEEAKLEADFSAMDEYIEEEEMIDFYDYEVEEARESVGLPSLKNFDEYLENEFIDSKDLRKILEIFEGINELIEQIEDTVGEYDDKENLHFKSNELEILNDENMKLLLDVFYYYTFEDTFKKLPDSLSIGEECTIIKVNKERLTLQWDKVDIQPCNGGSDIIKMYLKNKKNTIMATGWIEISYGFIEFDEEDHPGDGGKEYIEINLSSIIEELERIKDEYQNFLDMCVVFLDINTLSQTDNITISETL